ncbi:MAG: hypothetical protein AAFX99_35580, partial [Myxococcota bacterium]
GGRLWWIAAAALVFVIGALVIHRLATHLDQNDAPKADTLTTTPAGEDVDTFLADALIRDGQELERELAQKPGDRVLTAKLRWNRSLKAYLSQSAAREEEPVEDNDLPAAAVSWLRASAVLDALRSGELGSALSALEGLKEAKGQPSGVPSELMHWIEAEVALGQADLQRAQEAYRLSADDAFIPGLVGVMDICIRRGDLPCANDAMAKLQSLLPAHPAVSLGIQVMPVVQHLIDAPHILEPPVREPLSVQLKEKASLERRLITWVRLIQSDRPRVVNWDLVPTAHPTARLLSVRRLLADQKVDAAMAEYSTFKPDHAVGLLKRAALRLMSEGLAQVGRPRVALRYMPPWPEGQEMASYVSEQPDEALVRAWLLGDSGDFEQARLLLTHLLDSTPHASEARVIALQLHLLEGRADDVERHIERLKQHRGALVGSAALELYRGNPATALGLLGPPSVSSFPDRGEEPHMYRFEVRTRLLAMQASSQQEAIAKLLSKVVISASLRARVMGRTQSPEALREATAGSPASSASNAKSSTSGIAVGDP